MLERESHKNPVIQVAGNQVFSLNPTGFLWDFFSLKLNTLWFLFDHADVICIISYPPVQVQYRFPLNCGLRGVEETDRWNKIKTRKVNPMCRYFRNQTKLFSD